MAENKNPSTQAIYLKMLEYANECFVCGITFAQVKERLIQDKLFVEGQPDYPLLLLFERAFIHLHETCTNPDKPKEDCNCNDDGYDHLNKCPYFFSREGCMDFVKLAESINNENAARENQKAAESNLKVAKRTIAIGIIAIGIALVGAIFQIVEYIRPKNTGELKELQQIVVRQDSLNALLLSEFSKFQYEFGRTHNKDSLMIDFLRKNHGLQNHGTGKGATQQDK